MCVHVCGGKRREFREEKFCPCLQSTLFGPEDYVCNVTEIRREWLAAGLALGLESTSTCVYSNI